MSLFLVTSTPDLKIPIANLLMQITELLKIGSECYEDLKQFSVCVEEKLFRMDAHRYDVTIDDGQ